jgi:simple sugar transport system permease protein
MSLLASLGVSPFDTDWLGSALVLTTPILLAATGELISERAGVLNVGLEGMMLAGAFFSYYVEWKTGSLTAGVFAGIGGGLAFGVVMGLLAIEAGADQIVSGVGINLAAIGLTSYLFDQIFGNLAQIVLPIMGPVAIPGLSDIPDIGPALFDEDLVLYLAFLLVPAAWALLYRTKWGLAVRASGELPAAADTAGISVRRVRWAGVLTASALAGLGGAHLAVVEVGIFHQEMTAGRGFLALVAVIFGRWRPLGMLGACLALGGTDALQLRLADRSEVPRALWGAIVAVAVAFALYKVLVSRSRPASATLVVGTIATGAAIGLLVATPHVFLPIQLWRSLPYLLALVVLAGGVTRARMPSKLTLPYYRGES